MNKIISIIVACTFFAASINAQAPIVAQKLYTVKYKKLKPKGFSYDDVTRVGDHVLMLGEDERVLGTFIPWYLRPVTLNRFIDHGRVSTKTNKQIAFPADLFAVDLQLIGTLISKDKQAVKYFFNSYNTKTRTNVILACNVDLNTDKLTFTKIFESAKRTSDAPIAKYETVINKEAHEFAVVEIFAKKQDITFNYVVKDFDLSTLATKQNIRTRGIDANEIRNMTLTRKYDIVFNAVDVVKKASLFRKAIVSQDIYVTNENSAEKLSFNADKFEGAVSLFSRPNGEVSAVALYGDTRGEFDGILIASVDDETRTLSNANKARFNKLDFDNEDAKTETGKARAVKRDLGQATSNTNRIASIRFSEDGDMYLLVEQYKEVTHTTTTTSRTGVSTNSYTTYHYGPGVIYQINGKTNEMKNYIKLNYQFVTRYQMGKGLSFEAGNNGKVWVLMDNDFYKFDVDGRSVRLKSKTNALARAAKMWSFAYGRGANVDFNNIFLSPNSAIQVTTNRQRTIVSDLPLE
jgi:hypothetical protein